MKKIVLILFCLCMISFVYAGGCCFDRSMGTCAKNAEEGSCSAGDWSDDATCDSVTECQAGCCVLGNGVDFITASACYFKAQSMGLVENFQQINEVQCKKIQSKQKEGACIVTGRYEDKTCKYTTQASCTVGQFSEGILCSDALIKNKYNVTCTKTKNTMCYNEDAHFVDSCGNPDVKKQDCDYDKGTICSMNKSSATCKSLDCVDTDVNKTKRKNGESWCYYDGAKLDYFAIEEAEVAGSDTFGWVQEPVGSRFYRKYCLNGKIEVEACADMRNEACDVGKCVKNPWQECLSAGNKTEDCNPKWCFMFNGHPGCGIIRAGQTISGGMSGVSRIYIGYQGSGSAPGVINTGANNQPGTVGYVDPELSILAFAKFFTGNFVKNIITGNAVNSGNSYTATVDTPFCKGSDNEIMITDGELNDMGYTKDKRNMPEFRPEIRENVISASGMGTCIPKSPGGFLYEKQIGESSASTTCSSADVNTEMTFWEDKHEGSGVTSLTKEWHLLNLPIPSLGGSKYGMAGVSDLDAGDWRPYTLKDTDDSLSGGSSYAIGYSGSAFIEPYFIESFETKCMKTSDCAGQVNYLGSGGSGANVLNTRIVGDKNFLQGVGTTYEDRNAKKFTISFQCMPYEAPSNGDCEKCQEDNEKYPCSEYKCRSIGSNCEYIDGLGVDKAYCMKSSDLAAPKILSHSLSPKSPIKPFSSVQINLTTDEYSSCKFSLGKAGGKFEDMTFVFGNTWDKNHSLTLNIPGKIKENISDEEVQYEFLTRDGKYEMFVRCSDPRGNWNLEPYLIKFEVMDTPDSVPPALMYFNPKSGSPIEFDTTTKLVKFKMNEPAACKWAFSDMNFSEMPYYFNCDLSASRNGVLHGYDCSGILTNISANLSQATPFYIRCKDQPWLAGNETKFYKRNENEKSVVYLLRNSEKLEIVEFAPKGMVVVGPSVNNLTLTIRTKGGGEKGKAICAWKRSYGDQSSLLRNLSITNAILHKQVISNISEGDYEYYVECTDVAGNIATQTETLSIREDTGVPIISRVYNDKGSLKIATSEPAICKFASVLDASIGCAFSLNGANLTSMTSKAGNLEHSGVWKKGNYYYIKCQDLHGNTNSICGIAGKAV